MERVPKIWTHSNWRIDRRDNRYGDNKFHGNFIPEIPYQMILRYTKKGDWVLDPAAGSGTTGDVAKELGRNCDMYDLLPVRGDVRKADVCVFNYGREYDLIIYHPPYSNVIKFSDDPDDLSNCKDWKSFLERFEVSARNLNKFLKSKHILCLVCGEIWQEGEEIPLGFYCSEIFRNLGYKRKAIIVKDYGLNTQGGEVYSSKNKSLQRYRHLKYGTWEFCGDFIWVMEKL